MSGRPLLLIVGMALAVWLPKGLPLLLVSDRLPPGVARWLHYVAPAVLAALVAPNILMPDGRLHLGWGLAPYAVAFAVALLTRRVIPTLGAGLATLWLVSR